MQDEFDKGTLETIKDVMGDKFPHVVSNYIEGSRNYIDTIIEAEKTGDFPGMRDAAHPLKSSSATLGVIGLSEISAEIEKLSGQPQRDETELVKLQQLTLSLETSFSGATDFLQNSLEGADDTANEPAKETLHKVLHIDDESVIRKVTGRILTDAGFEVQSYETVEGALQNLRDYQPDIILVDFMMPDMEGMQSLLNFKADHRLAEVPVVFVTGLDEDKVKESLGGYIQGYIPKPCKPDELVSQVRKFCA